jgi:ribonuclease HI
MAAVRWLLSLPPDKQYPATIRSDSELIVKQLEGDWRCKDEKLITLHDLIIKAKRRYPRMIKFHWIPREKNAEVDALSRTAYDDEELQYFRDNQLDILFNGDDLSF